MAPRKTAVETFRAPSEDWILGLLACLGALASPLLLIPIVQVVGYSLVFEELAKAVLVAGLLMSIPEPRLRLALGSMVGLLFGISESLLYFGQIFAFGDLGVFAERFLLTVPMHTLTVLIMVFCSLRGRRFVWIGLGLALALHLMFNLLVS